MDRPARCACRIPPACSTLAESMPGGAYSPAGWNGYARKAARAELNRANRLSGGVGERVVVWEEEQKRMEPGKARDMAEGGSSTPPDAEVSW